MGLPSLSAATITLLVLGEWFSTTAQQWPYFRPSFKLVLSETSETSNPGCWKDGQIAPCWVETYIGYDIKPDCTEYFDGQCDAFYIRPFVGPPNPPTNFDGVMLASVVQYSSTNTDNIVLSINQLPYSFLEEEHTVPLYHYTGKPENYTITMIEVKDFPADYNITLIDMKVTDGGTAMHPLNTGPYTFLGDPDDDSNNYPGDAGKFGSDRFVLMIPAMEMPSAYPSSSPTTTSISSTPSTSPSSAPTVKCTRRQLNKKAKIYIASKNKKVNKPCKYLLKNPVEEQKKMCKKKYKKSPKKRCHCICGAL